MFPVVEEMNDEHGCTVGNTEMNEERLCQLRLPYVGEDKASRILGEKGVQERQDFRRRRGRVSESVRIVLWSVVPKHRRETYMWNTPVLYIFLSSSCLDAFLAWSMRIAVLESCRWWPSRSAGEVKRLRDEA